MESIYITLSSLWMYFPSWIRAVFLVIVLLYLIYFTLIKLLPKVLVLFILIVEKVYAGFVYVIDTITGLILFMSIKRGKKNFMFVLKLEQLTQTILLKFNSLKKIVDFKAENKRKFKRRYVNVSILIVLVIGIIIAKLPDNKISTTWLEINDWVFFEILQGDLYYDDIANRLVEGIEEQEDEIEAVHAEIIKMRLVPGTEGGNLRKEPVSSTTVNNIIEVIGESEELIFLGEEETLGGITWVKVETSNGLVGWISSAIVELK
ncbi:SH3 domain-containing protein [Chengkuizengella axinellae]|uniref:SH3 domain-containing protein n=1 Tax=Chengkuizengella axinellae TaxID=3064388 RepID=A0ABT9J0F2_9BACL|nr:SH3 domain-containing protein [Chengkuizengella sp. 2205SS18-9]MDP5274963.1 SH3 domain-containing protein [Chengkuizengella sp. 2205SS18-9]